MQKKPSEEFLFSSSVSDYYSSHNRIGVVEKVERVVPLPVHSRGDKVKRNIEARRRRELERDAELALQHKESESSNEEGKQTMDGSQLDGNGGGGGGGGVREYSKYEMTELRDAQNSVLTAFRQLRLGGISMAYDDDDDKYEHESDSNDRIGIKAAAGGRKGDGRGTEDAGLTEVGGLDGYRDASEEREALDSSNSSGSTNNDDANTRHDNNLRSFDSSGIYEIVHISEADNRVLADDIFARFHHPPFRASIVDGYAIHVDDNISREALERKRFYITGRVNAGDTHDAYAQASEASGDLCVGGNGGETSGNNDADSLNSLVLPSPACSVPPTSASFRPCTQPPDNPVHSPTVYVSTGAALPDLYNAVIPVEECLIVGNMMKIVPLCSTPFELHAGYNVRPVGSDIKKGEKVLKKNAKLRAGEIGILYALGLSTVKVYRVPRVVILSTGNELQSNTGGEEILRKNCVYDSNRPLLSSLVKTENCEIVDSRILLDNKDVLCEYMDKLISGEIQTDIVISTGGVSMGRADYVKPLLQSKGNVMFGRMNIKPGKPTTFGVLKRKHAYVSKEETSIARREETGAHKFNDFFDMPVKEKKEVSPYPKPSPDYTYIMPRGIPFFALPGNPVSAWTACQLLVVPALRYCQTSVRTPFDSILPPEVSVTLAHDVRGDVARPEYHRCILFTAPSTMFPPPEALGPHPQHTASYEDNNADAAGTPPHSFSSTDSSFALSSSMDTAARYQHYAREAALLEKKDAPAYEGTSRWARTTIKGPSIICGVSTGEQSSSRLRSVAYANGLLTLPAGGRIFKKGEVVTAVVIGALSRVNCSFVKRALAEVSEINETSYRPITMCKCSGYDKCKNENSGEENLLPTPPSPKSPVSRAPQVGPSSPSRASKARLPPRAPTEGLPSSSSIEQEAIKHFSIKRTTLSGPGALDGPRTSVTGISTSCGTMAPVHPSLLHGSLDALPSKSSSSSKASDSKGENVKAEKTVKVNIIVVSDRAHTGAMEDNSGKNIEETLTNRIQGLKNKTEILSKSIVPDEPALIVQAINAALDKGCDLMVITGGTGLTHRDRTPEAVESMLTRRLRGMENQMYIYGLQKTPMASLSRLVCGCIDRSLVLCLPGSPVAVEECLIAVAPVLPHALELIRK